MAKSSKNSRSKGPAKSPKNEVRVTAVILGLLIIILSLVFFLNQEKKHNAMPRPQPPVEAVAPEVKHRNPIKPIAVSRDEDIAVKPALPSKKVLPGSAGRIAFILDDWGESLRNCKYLKDIPDPLAVAILPDLRNTDNVAKCASQYHKVIMLHLPMEPVHNNDPYPVDYVLKTTMKPAKVEKILNGYLSRMPYIEGVNNHMGSKATEDRSLMTVVLKRLKKRGVFFVDSMTAPDYSKSKEVAESLHLPFAQRDVFLDNINTHDEIVKQIESIKLKLPKKGYAVAIGHDRELTLRVLKEQIPLLKKEGYEIVSIKDLLETK